MAEKRKPECRIIFEEGRRRKVAELFPAGLFPGGEAFEGQYRVRINRSWLRPQGGKYVFLTLGEAFSWMLLEAEGFPETPLRALKRLAPQPDLPKGSRVSVENGRVGPDGTRLRDRTFTATAPFQGVDGDWRVFLVGREEPVLVEELVR